jgi:hypothetical protein
MRHGYTNLTDTDGQVVVKRYQGADAALRATREQQALRSFAGIVPVPPLVSAAAEETVTGLVAGVHGQDLIDAGRTGTVLRACGELARLVANLPTDGFTQVEPLPATGLAEVETLADRVAPVLCHGDFGPQNVLLDERTGQVTALLDWELVAVGHPLRDLSWAEWIVRMHHPDRVEDLDALFAGYGARPAWPDRQAQMVAACERLLAFVEDRPGPQQREAVGLWRLRTRTTAAWTQ